MTDYHSEWVERRERYGAIRAILIKGILADMPEWTLLTDPHEAVAHIGHADGVRSIIVRDATFDGRRLALVGIVHDEHRQSSEEFRAAHITVRADRDPRTIAKDIERRLLPALDAHVEQWLKKNTKHMAQVRAMEDAAARVMAAFPQAEMYRRRNDKIGVDVYQNGNSLSIALSLYAMPRIDASLSLDIVLALANVLNTATASDEEAT